MLLIQITITGRPDQRGLIKDLIKRRRTQHVKESTDICDAIEITSMWNALSQKIQETHPKKVGRSIRAFEKNVIGHYEECIEDCLERINE